jgi:predicted transport protein
MFRQFKLIIIFMMFTAVAGAGLYVAKLRSDNQTLIINQQQMDEALKTQAATLEKQEKDFKDILESNKKLNMLINTFKQDLDDLDKRFNKKSRDIGKLAIEKPKPIERIINKGAKNAARCMVLASGAEHTEAELKATLKSEINPECPALANPSYVPHQ